MKRIALILFASIIGTLSLLGQIIETEPGIPTMSQTITIYFNTDKLDASHDLYQFEGELYGHTGVSIEGAGRWQNVIESWGNNTTQPQLSYQGSYRYKLEISPDIEHFYPDDQGNPIGSGVKVTEICLVIRSAAADKQTEDLFINVYEAGLEVSITNPVDRSMVIEQYNPLNISVSATQADSILLFIDNVEVKKEIGTNQLTHTKFLSETGGAWVHAKAYEDLNIAVDSFYYYVPGLPVEEELPAGIEDGINYNSDTEVTLVITAPDKSWAFVTGDFNSWLKGDDSYMKVTPDGEKFWKVIGGLIPGKEYRYQYVIDDITIADPYTEKVLDQYADPYIDEETYPELIDYPVGFGSGHVGILQTSEPAYTWQTTGFVPPEKTDLVIYELLLRDFLSAHNYVNLIDTLNYLADLGVNAIELMPVNEFDDNESWGYNPSFYFAPDKYYGTKNKLKEFIDSCHARGIAVILDMVLNHATGNSPMAKLYWDAGNNKTASDNPWFNVDATHDYNVFHDFNHESEFTRYHAKRVMSHWIEEYKVDGYRFDLSKGFTQKNTIGNVGAWGQYDASRVALWKIYSDHIWAEDSDFYVILEHFADNSEETELAEYGMMLWQKMSERYSEISMGFSESITWASYLNRGWTVPSNIVYMESHDEERMQFRNINYGNALGLYNIREFNTGLERIILSACFFFTVPGPKMIWQFGELGYDYSIDLNGRTGNKPIRWDFLNTPERLTVNQAFSELIKLKTLEPAFKSSDFIIVEEGLMKRIEINHESMDVRILGNFDVSNGALSGEFSKTGKWYEFFSGDSINVSNTAELFTLVPGEYRLYTTKRFEKPNFAVSIKDLLFRDTESSFFNVYPNPVRDFITLETTDIVASNIDRLRLTTLTGTVVLELKNVSQNQIDLSSLEKGVYLLSLEAGSYRGVKRIVKMN